MKKPVIAFKLESEARENIYRKIQHFKKLVSQGVVGADVPSSFRQFNAWTYSGDADGDSFVKNANETLARHKELRTEVGVLIELVKGVSTPVLRPRDIGLARAREQSRRHLKIRQIAEAYALGHVSENISLRKEIEALRAQIKSISDESERMQNLFDNESQKLMNRIADLLRERDDNVRLIREYGKK